MNKTFPGGGEASAPLPMPAGARAAAVAGSPFGSVLVSLESIELLLGRPR